MGKVKEEFDKWHSTFVMLEMTKSIGHRETALLPYNEEIPDFQKGYAVRNLHCKSLDFLKNNLKVFKFNERAMKIYTSLALFKEFPNLSYAYTVRAREQSILTKDIAKHPTHYIEGMDMLWDIDSKNFQSGYDQTRGILNILKENEVPFFVMPSGGKRGGFHIRIRWEELSDVITDWQVVSHKNYLLCHNMKRRFPDIDESLFDLRRVGKMPYSIVRSHDKWNVCLPLSYDEFLNFNEGDNEVNKVLRNFRLVNRGLKVNSGTSEGLRTFISHFAVK